MKWQKCNSRVLGIQVNYAVEKEKGELKGGFSFNLEDPSENINKNYS